MAKGYKYKQAKKEYQYKLRNYFNDNPKEFKGKALIAKKVGVSPQRLNNWINRDSWNDLSNYTEAQTEIKFSEDGKIEGKHNKCKLTKELYDRLFFYLSILDPATGKRKLSNEEISTKLGISVTTFYRYLETDVPFYKIYQRAKLKVKGEVALDKLLDGYTQNNVKVEVGETPKGYVNKKIIEKKEIGPDSRAVTFALKNADPENYSDNPKAAVKVEINNNIDIKNLSDEELEKIIKGE